MIARSISRQATSCAGASLILLVTIQPAPAAIVSTGDVFPSTFGAETFVIYVGHVATGSLTIDEGSVFTSQIGYVGYMVEATGSSTVTGSGSTWNCESRLTIGDAGGTGVLNIRDGGVVNVTGKTIVADSPGSTGTIHLDQGMLNTSSLYADFDDLVGTGMIQTHGLIADELDVTFTPALAPAQQIVLNSLPDQNVVLHLTQDQTGDLGAGYDGGGSVTIRDGLHVDSKSGFVGFLASSSGTMRVSGPGTEWDIHESLGVGYAGYGVLYIADSAVVNVERWLTVGVESGASGIIAFDQGTLYTDTLCVDADDMTGTGTIHTHGLIAEGFDLVIDADRGVNQTIRLNNHPDQDVTIHMGLGWGDELGAGLKGNGSLAIRGGVTIENSTGYIGYMAGSNAIAEVSGQGTRWRLYSTLHVGTAGNGELTIRDGALVMAEDLTMNDLSYYYGNTSFINLANGGMLALEGQADATLMDFYGLIFYYLNGWSDALRYWDAQQGVWTGLTNATPGEDYALEYHDTGDLAGYTVLTVNAVPEPQAVLVLCLGGAVLWYRNRH